MYQENRAFNLIDIKFQKRPPKRTIHKFPKECRMNY